MGNPPEKRFYVIGAESIKAALIGSIAAAG
jgi:hypothetical protein